MLGEGVSVEELLADFPDLERGMFWHASNSQHDGQTSYGWQREVWVDAQRVADVHPMIIGKTLAVVWPDQNAY